MPTYKMSIDVRLAKPINIEGEAEPAIGFFQVVGTDCSSLTQAVEAAESAILKAAEWASFGDETGRIESMEIKCTYDEPLTDDAFEAAFL